MANDFCVSFLPPIRNCTVIRFENENNKHKRRVSSSSTLLHSLSRFFLQFNWFTFEQVYFVWINTTIKRSKWWSEGEHETQVKARNEEKTSFQLTHSGKLNKSTQPEDRFNGFKRPKRSVWTPAADYNKKLPSDLREKCVHHFWNLFTSLNESFCIHTIQCILRYMRVFVYVCGAPIFKCEIIFLLLLLWFSFWVDRAIQYFLDECAPSIAQNERKRTNEQTQSKVNRDF